MSKKILKKYFFNRPTLIVARELLGCFLCRRNGRKIIRLEITEVEAYDGPRDRASHAARGRTSRNAPMFGEAGTWYVYFTYGMHWMLNIVTGSVGYPAAILIRSAICRGQTSTELREEICGPARLTKFLKINGILNGKTANRISGLWIENGRRIPAKKIRRAPRIGVAYSGEKWSRKPYRFTVTHKTNLP